MYLFVEGCYEWFWEVLGVYFCLFIMVDGVVSGVLFVVWVFNVKGVSLIGEFNGWNGYEVFMWVFGLLGVWELFWFDFFCDGLYKFCVYGVDGVVIDWVDLFVFGIEVLL